MVVMQLSLLPSSNFKALKSQLAETLCLISTEKRHGTSLLLGTWVNALWLHWSWLFEAAEGRHAQAPADSRNYELLLPPLLARQTILGSNSALWTTFPSCKLAVIMITAFLACCGHNPSSPTGPTPRCGLFTLSLAHSRAHLHCSIHSQAYFVTSGWTSERSRWTFATSRTVTAPSFLGIGFRTWCSWMELEF